MLDRPARRFGPLVFLVLIAPIAASLVACGGSGESTDGGSADLSGPTETAETKPAPAPAPGKTHAAAIADCNAAHTKAVSAKAAPAASDWLACLVKADDAALAGTAATKQDTLEPNVPQNTLERLRGTGNLACDVLSGKTVVDETAGPDPAAKFDGPLCAASFERIIAALIDSDGPVTPRVVVDARSKVPDCFTSVPVGSKPTDAAAACVGKDIDAKVDALVEKAGLRKDTADFAKAVFGLYSANTGVLGICAKLAGLEIENQATESKAPDAFVCDVDASVEKLQVMTEFFAK